MRLSNSPILQNLNKKIYIVGLIVVIILILKVILHMNGGDDMKEGYFDMNPEDFIKNLIKESPGISMGEIFRKFDSYKKQPQATFQRANQLKSQSLVQQLQATQKVDTVQDAIQGYNDFIGFIYANPRVSGTALDDLRGKLFPSDTCPWRPNWNVAGEVSKPPSPGSKQKALEGYQKWVQCLVKGEQKCIQMVSDVRSRFFKAGCPVMLPLQKGRLENRYIPDLFPMIRS